MDYDPSPIWTHATTTNSTPSVRWVQRWRYPLVSDSTDPQPVLVEEMEIVEDDS